MPGPRPITASAAARSRRFSTPGPASSGVPVDSLAYAGLATEIEAVAWLDITD